MLIIKYILLKDNNNKLYNTSIPVGNCICIAFKRSFCLGLIKNVISRFARAIKISTGINPLPTIRFNVCATQGIQDTLGNRLAAMIILLPLSVVIKETFSLKPHSEIKSSNVCDIILPV